MKKSSPGGNRHMTVKFEKSNENPNTGILTFEIAQEEVKKGLDQAFKKVKKNLQVPGFRKGKVPRQIFNNVYGEEALYDDALQLLLPTAYEKAVEESELEIVAQPKIDIESIGKDQPWVLTAEVTVKPEVKLGDYKGLEVEAQDREVTDEEVEQAIEAKRHDFAELVLKEGAAEEGDTVVIDYVGSVDGEEFEGGSAENHSLQLGSSSFIPGFEDQLIGAEPDSEVEVKVTFPEEYHAENLAGKDAVFQVKVHEVKTTELPELDDDFAHDVDDEVESYDEYVNKVRVQLEENKNSQADELEEDAALRQAVENAEVIGGLPYDMVHEEVHRQMDYFLNNMQRQGISPDLYYQITNTTEEDLHEQFEEEAELRTKTNLVLEAIVAAENIEASEAEIDEEVESLASQYGMEADQVRNFVSPEMVANDVKLKKAMSLIVDSATKK